MVVDAELEAAKSVVLELMKDKDAIEAEMINLKAVLDSNDVGMNEALVDSEGYPRNDIDVYRVRHARHKIICLRNDHKQLMKKIEQGLSKIHKCTSMTEANSYNPVQNPVKEEPCESLYTEPFLRVNLVTSGSPAESAGIRENDKITEFGSVNYQNFKSLKDIGSLVEHSRFKPIVVKVKRDTDILSLTLIPRPWSDKGLLGCNVIPLEMVER
ncbi:26S proteasome non-ATPase regulatory subunit 9 [Venturia canescens]|uniref:26S proteasome non-ATPase regulatory subunit 9 n=1 Tax=Venturia canescens TaxID=32260 RepID=UPI001C9C5ED3|nr:26S proteasome non-ATPase regulatory subunit 9 [Venturia canescens]